jgi:hypothetical protein
MPAGITMFEPVKIIRLADDHKTLLLFIQAETQLFVVVNLAWW